MAMTEDNKENNFDICLMNPPYANGLYMKFLKKSSEISNKLISVQPINKFQDAKMNENDFPIAISSIDILTDGNKSFNVSFKYQLGITIIDDKNKTTKTDKIKCILYENIYDKIRKKTKETFNSKIKKEPKGQFTLRCGKNTGFDPEHNYNWVSKNYEIACSQMPSGHIGFISLDNEIERVNLFKYCNTHFFKFCIIIASANLAPYMGDYNHEWTDEKLFNYFELTKEEQNTIIKLTDEYV